MVILMGSPLKSIWAVHLATLAFFLGIMIVAPIISPFSISLGATPLIIGFLSALTSITAFIMRPIFGLISDRGYRFETMMLGAFLGCIAALIYASSSNIWIFAVARIIHGLASASFLPASISTAIDLAPPDRVGETLGWRSTMFGVSQLAGPGIGGYISDLTNYNTTFIATLILSMVSLGVLFIARRWAGKYTSERVERRSSFRDIRRLFKLTFICPMIAVAFHAISYSGVFTFLPALYKELGFGASVYGLYASVQGGFSILTRATSGRIADRKGPIPVASLGLILVIVSYLLLYVNYLPPVAYIAASIFGIGLGLIVPSLQLLALGDLPSEIRGFASGIYIMAFDLGFLLGPLIMGYYIELTGSYTSILTLFPIFATISFIAIQFARLAKHD